MRWLDFILRPNRREASATTAKERLQVIFAHEKSRQSSPDYLPKLQKEIMEVIAKYVKIDPDQVKVEFEQNADRAILELNVTLPENIDKPVKKAKTSRAKKSTV